MVFRRSVSRLSSLLTPFIPLPLSRSLSVRRCRSIRWLLSIFGAFTKGQHAHCTLTHIEIELSDLAFFCARVLFSTIEILNKHGTQPFYLLECNPRVRSWLSVGVSLMPFCQSGGFCAWFLLWLFKLSFRFCFEIVFVALRCALILFPFRTHTHAAFIWAFLCVYIPLPFFSVSLYPSASYRHSVSAIWCWQLFKKCISFNFWAGNEDKLKIGRLKLRMERWWWFKYSILNRSIIDFQHPDNRTIFTRSDGFPTIKISFTAFDDY